MQHENTNMYKYPQLTLVITKQQNDDYYLTITFEQL